MFRLNEFVSIQPNIVALSLVSLVVMMGSSMVTPSLTLYAQDIGANEFLVGAVIAGFAIGRLVFDIPAGFLTDRLGMGRTMIHFAACCYPCKRLFILPTGLAWEGR